MPLRASTTLLSWPLWGLLVTVLAGLLLGGHQREAFADFSLFFSYGYWIVRLGMAFLLFAGCLLLLEIAPPAARLGWGWLAAAAALLTLPFFTLSVTMFDMLLGLPELGITGFGLDSGGAREAAVPGMASLFAMESVYHLDNHLVLCALIVLPRVLLGLREEAVEAAETEAASTSAAAAPVALRPAAAPKPQQGPAPAFFERFDPPLKAPVLAVQAQEHYVRVVTAEGAVTTLYRFGDALRELERLSGLQVHRSFWVADDGVARLKAGRRGLKIVLRNGEQVPVSARHAKTVQRRYGGRLEPVSRERRLMEV